VLGGAGYATLNFNVPGEAVQLGTFLSTSLTTVNIAGTGGLLLDGNRYRRLQGHDHYLDSRRTRHRQRRL
jgi:hypothetical protein